MNRSENSVNTHISYVNSTDIHITSSLGMYKAGKPLPEVADDIDFESRDPLTPDIGADEFEIDSLNYYDIYLTEILSPDSTICAKSDSLISGM